MKLTILGSGCATIKKDWKSSSCLVELENLPAGRQALPAGRQGQKLLFDTGWGPVIAAYEGIFDPKDIDHILITHPHPDHMGGLMNLLQSQFVSGIFYPGTERNKPLYLHGYQGFEKDYETLRTMMFPEREEPYAITVKEHFDGTKVYSSNDSDKFAITGKEVKHNPQYFNSSAFRIDADVKSFVYSGDLGYDEAFIDLAQDADVAVIELSFSVEFYQKFGPRSNHLSPIEVGEIAKKANIKKLILSHRYSNHDESRALEEIRKNYDGEVVFARDGDVFEI